MPTANLGRVGFVNKGVWADGLHKINDLVTFDTAKYACILQHTSTLGDIIPTNTTYWEKWTDYGIHSVTNIANTATSSADSQYINYFTGTNTGALSIKITGLVSATASDVDLGFMEITITQDDRDTLSATNPASYKIMIKGNMDTGVWYNTQAVMLGSSVTTPINVRFTRTATDAYIEIGEVSSTWYYPTVEIAHVSSYVLIGYTPVFLATIQASILGTTTDSIISVSKKIENTIQSAVASATTCTIGTFALGDTVHITGTTTITSLGVSTSGTTRRVIFNDALTLTHNATSLILPTSTNIITVIGDTAEFVCEDGSNGYWTCTKYQRKDGTALASSFTNTNGVRQTVQSSAVDTSGFANFISIGAGLSVNIAATATNIRILTSGENANNDRVGNIIVDTSISSLTSSSTLYFYADVSALGVVTLGFTTLAPIYQFGGTPSTTNGQFTFNVGEMKGYLGNGATAPQAWRVYIGEAVTGASTVTSVVTYALNGLYDSGYTATLPSTSTLISKNSNLGVKPDIYAYVMECTTADIGYSVGDTVCIWSGNATGSTNTPGVSANKNTVHLSNWALVQMINKTSPGNNTGPTAASWKYKFIAKRGW